MASPNILKLTGGKGRKKPRPVRSVAAVSATGTKGRVGYRKKPAAAPVRPGRKP